MDREKKLTTDSVPSILGGEVFGLADVLLDLGAGIKQ